MATLGSKSILQSRTGRWAVGLGVVFMVGVAMVLLFLLTLATDNQAFYESNFTRLVAINIAVAAVLLLVLLWLSVRLAVRLRRRRFGSQLLLKLAAIFALVGFLPGLLIYTVSYQFVSRSIENWFDVRVETALNAGLNLGRTTLDTLVNDLTTKTRAAATALSANNIAAGVALERLREQLGASDVVLWGGNGQLIASAGDSRYELSPARPSAALLRSIRGQRIVSSIDGLDELEALLATGAAVDKAPSPRIRVLALVTASGFGLVDETRYLQVTAVLPEALASDAVAVQIAHREYQERVLARDGLRRMYIGTLTLALFLAVFGAVLLAVVLGNQLVRPLLVLAEGMRDVAKGDLTPKASMTARDELAGLTRTFAHMTQELSDARQAVQQSMQQVDSARANLQAILDNLSAGVVVLDADNRILSANPGATRILRAPLAEHQWQGLQAVPALTDFALWVHQQFDQFMSGEAPLEGGHWQQSFEMRSSQADLDHPDRQADVITLLVRGALLPHGERLLVIDDVSDIVSAQRAQAWGEVARRLAHEIKNPLTPIQLSAERLAMKLDGKLEGADATVLNKSVRTIVDQVDAMKRLVNEFRDYARLPAAHLMPTDLNALITDVMALYDHAGVPVLLDLEPSCPRVLADAQQVRQLVHNLVQNAQDATPAGAGAVRLQTRPSDSGRWVRLFVLDHGPGFPEAILKRAFEPYVTTKAKGTGLGLAVVKKIMDDHGGRAEISHRLKDGQIVGAQVSLSFKVADSQHL